MTDPVKPRGPTRIAVNVMRARQTVIGFNIAIVSFQIAQLYRLSGGITVPGVGHEIHVRADIALYFSLALALIALIALTVSSIWDEVGVCTHWSLVAGDVLMYLSLAYTVTGFFEPLAESMRISVTSAPALSPQATLLHTGVVLTAGIAWFLAMYVAPIASLLRSPFPRRINQALWSGYVVVVLLLAWLNAQARAIEFAAAGESVSMPAHLLAELLQPFAW